MSISAPPRPRRPSHPVEREQFDAIVEALIEEARQRARRRRRVQVAAVTVAVLVAVLLLLAAWVGSARSDGASPDFAVPSAVSAGPTRSQIAFSVWEYNRGPGLALYVISPDGTGQRRVARFTSVYGPHTPAWSPDGRELAFVSMPNGDEDVFVVNVDGSGKRNLTRHPRGEYGPAWSPDGRRIAWERFTYFSHTDPENAVYVMSADGTGKRMLARGGGPVWSPDGRTIAFTSFRRGGSAAVMKANGSGQRVLVPDASPAAWSPDGRKLLLSRGVGWDASERVPERTDLYVVNADGSGLRRLMRNAAGASWSPDGRKIAFEFYRGPAGIYVMNVDGTGLRMLTARDGLHLPVWSPDGSVIAFRSDQGTYPQVYLVNADGSGERQLTRNRASSELSFSWSPAQTS